jgi:hypothetical protein
MMSNLPPAVAALFLVFAPLFSKRVWKSAEVLLVGAILAPGKRTITSILRVMGLSQEHHFQNYHRVLSRACWSSRAVSRRLLLLLVSVFVPIGPVIFGIDDTIERRKGAKIKAKGIYRDPVRSSQSQCVKTSGLRWLSVMLLVEIPWAQRVWALPFWTVLAPSERYSEVNCKTHKRLTDWGRQMLLQVRRWLPNREIVVVGASSFAVLDLLHELGRPLRDICMITRLRLDAALYEPVVPPQPGQMGRPRLKGKRLPNLSQVLMSEATHCQTVILERWYSQSQRVVEVASGTAVWYHTGKSPVPIRWVLVSDPKGEFESQALLSTHLDDSPVQILNWFVQRWQLEVTFEEVRAHLGMESQRQWADLAILRTTPTILGLFSLVTEIADALQSQFSLDVRQADWYIKPLPTFSDAIAWVRSSLWPVTFSMSTQDTDMLNVSRSVLERLMDTLIYAA